jgi:chromosome segregation ATPase
LRQVEQETELTAPKVTSEADPELVDLERQVSELDRDTSACESNGAVGEETMLGLLDSQLIEVTREIERQEQCVPELEIMHKELEKGMQEAQQLKLQLESDMKRERQKRETEEELAGQSPEDQKLILKAHEEKLLVREKVLQDQYHEMQQEVEKRKANVIELEKERNELRAKTDDALLQKQIVEEERDAMREALTQTWEEWSALDSFLSETQDSYTSLSDRLQQQEDELQDMYDELEKLQQETSDLQRNGIHK